MGFADRRKVTRPRSASAGFTAGLPPIIPLTEVSQLSPSLIELLASSIDTTTPSCAESLDCHSGVVVFKGEKGASSEDEPFNSGAERLLSRCFGSLSWR